MKYIKQSLRFRKIVEQKLYSFKDRNYKSGQGRELFDIFLFTQKSIRKSESPPLTFTNRFARVHIQPYPYKM